jgi:hypothetical protein
MELGSANFVLGVSLIFAISILPNPRLVHQKARFDLRKLIRLFPGSSYQRSDRTALLSETRVGDQ